MRFSAMAGFALFVAPLALAAQSSGTTSDVFGPLLERNQQQMAAMQQLLTALCPVSFQAQHKADGSMVQVGNAHPRGLGQWLHLVLRDTRPLAKATVTVYGYTNKARMTQAGTVGGNRGDAVRTMTVTFAAQPDGTAAGELWAPGMTAVLRIDLDSVRYADGAARSFTDQQTCHVVPDPFMLVAGR